MEATNRKVKAKRLQITISAQGSLKFKQALVDRLYELLMEEDIMGESAKPGNGLTFESSLPPSEVE